ncbi:MAG: hypothetical protein ABFC89_00660 [Methanospirillum sp.]
MTGLTEAERDEVRATAMAVLHDAIPSIVTADMIERSLERVAADLGITPEETFRRAVLGMGIEA